MDGGALSGRGIERHCHGGGKGHRGWDGGALSGGVQQKWKGGYISYRGTFQ